MFAILMSDVFLQYMTTPFTAEHDILVGWISQKHIFLHGRHDSVCQQAFILYTRKW